MSGQKLIRVFNAGALLLSCSRPMRAKACILIPMSTIVTSRRTMQIPRRRLLWTTVRFAISISSRISILPTGSSTVSSVCWKPFSGRSVTIRQSLRYRARSSVRAACNRVDKFVPEPFVSGTIRPHVPIGAAKHRFHRVFSLIGRITGRCPYLAKTDPFYILKHRIILCIHLGA